MDDLISIDQNANAHCGPKTGEGSWCMHPHTNQRQGSVKFQREDDRSPCTKQVSSICSLSHIDALVPRKFSYSPVPPRWGGGTELGLSQASSIRFPRVASPSHLFFPAFAQTATAPLDDIIPCCLQLRLFISYKMEVAVPYSTVSCVVTWYRECKVVKQAQPAD